MKANKIITFGAVFILAFAAGCLVAGQHWDVFLTSYIPSLATLIAAYYGASFAFKFQNDKEREEIKHRNMVNGNNAIFALSRMTTKLVNLQRQIINPTRDSPARFLEMRPVSTLEKDDIKLDIEKLYFLLETDDRNLLGEVAVEEERYRSAIDAINERSRIHLNEVQPLLEHAGFVLGGNYTFAQIEAMVGQRLFSIIVQNTDQVISHVDSAVLSINLVANKLTASLKKQYPGKQIISFVIPDE